MKKNLLNLLIVIFLPLCFTGCKTLTLVQAYDKDLYANTENFYKDASIVIAKGMSDSPLKSNEIEAIVQGKEKDHPGHYSNFKLEYERLVVESNSLILRSLANSSKIGKLGNDIQTKVENAIVKQIKTECDTSQEQFKNVSLTTRNYIDLKCMIVKWQRVHKDQPKGILKSALWEGRNLTLFNAILAIQKAEVSKKQNKE